MSIQLKKGALELCVLSILHKEATYGYVIYQQLAKIMSISESTIYPVLRRLVKQGYVETYLKPSSFGPARKYFTLSSKGLGHYHVLRREWKEFKTQIDILIGSD